MICIVQFKFTTFLYIVKWQFNCCIRVTVYIHNKCLNYYVIPCTSIF